MKSKIEEIWLGTDFNISRNSPNIVRVHNREVIITMTSKNLNIKSINGNDSSNVEVMVLNEIVKTVNLLKRFLWI